jgi:hypothetical protein
MDGPELVKFTLDVVPPLIDRLLADSRWSRENVDMYLMHQATTFMLDHLRERMSLEREVTPEALELCGNTVSSTIPILIDDLRRSGRLRPGKQTVMAGFGVGLSWAGCAWTETWQAKQVQPADATAKQAESPDAKSPDAESTTIRRKHGAIPPRHSRLRRSPADALAAGAVVRNLDGARAALFAEIQVSFVCCDRKPPYAKGRKRRGGPGADLKRQISVPQPAGMSHLVIVQGVSTRLVHPSLPEGLPDNHLRALLAIEWRRDDLTATAPIPRQKITPRNVERARSPQPARWQVHAFRAASPRPRKANQSA